MDNLLTAYSLGERLHQSARTAVYRGRRRSDGAPCIIKLQHREHPSVAEIDRFHREYEITTRLALSGVARPLALCAHKNRLALVMEDCGSISLRAYMSTRTLSMDEILSIAIELATTLGHIHEHHVVHKDINPANIIIHPDSKRAKFIDFGIATTLSREKPSFHNPELLEGMLPYISPEQTGRTHRAIDYRADFYSLGVTLYEVVTGQLPFTSTDPLQLIHCHIAVAPESPTELKPSLPPVISRLLMKLLAKAAEARYQSGAGLAADLDICRARLRENGRIDNFELARHDVSDRFEIPQKRYGRSAERDILRAAFERTAVGRPEILLVAGYSGMGKSSLVLETHHTLPAQATGYFAAGKFDQLRRNIPYAPLIEAFQDLIRQLLAESESSLDSWRDKLRAALGANAAVIADVIPAVTLILGEVAPVAPLPAAQARNRFHFAFQHFVRVFAAPEHPLVIFLDDLQWADAASLDLIRILMTDVGLRYLCFIGAYRDNEVGAEHPLHATLGAVADNGTRATTLTLKPLGLDDVVRMIEDTLHCGDERAMPLATLLLQKTEGNPFFINQLLGALYEEHLIEFDVATRTWEWDLDAIRERGLTGGIVELMVGKIQKLAPDAQKTLQLAACIGNRFDLATLAIVAEQSAAATAASFWDALEQGLLLPIDDAYRVATPERLTAQADETPDAAFRFLHDRLQDAAYSLIPASERPKLHAQLGRLLRSKTPDHELDDKLVDIVNQLVLGLPCIESRDERYETARLCLMAGKKAKAAVAFEPAQRYLRTGLELLPENGFAEQHELAFTLHIHGAETEYLNADLKRAEELAIVALGHAQTALEHARVAEARILIADARNQFDQTIRIGLAALEKLDVHLPYDATLDDFWAARKHNKELLDGREPHNLLDLPLMTDPAHLAAQRILAQLGSPCFVSRPQLFPLVASERFRLSVAHGNSRYSPGGYVLYGALHARLMNDFDTAMAYGDLSVEVMEKLNVREIKAEVYMLNAALIRSWKRHISELFDLLREGITAGIECGDLYHANRCGSNLCHASVVGGARLQPLFATMTRVAELTKKNKLSFLQSYVEIMRQWVQNLLGKAKDPLILTGDCFNEENDLPPLLEAKNLSTTGLFFALKAMLAYLFGEFGQAVVAGERAQLDKPGMNGLPTSVLVNLYQSLPLLAVWSDLDPAEQEKALATVEKNQAEMKGWADNAPMNFLHRWQLVEAEKHRVLGNHATAMSLYEKAIRNAAEQRFLPEQAIANERCAEMCRAQGWEFAADSFLTEAHYAYLRWGAQAKVADIEWRFPTLLSRHEINPLSLIVEKHTTTISESHTTSGSAMLELRSVMKAAQAISGQLVLGDLVQSLLRIMAENAGAERGVLLLQQNDRLVVRSEWSTDMSEVTEREGTLAEDSQLLPPAIVHFAARTGESVVLPDAAREGRFSKDPYVSAKQSKSILCTPLLNQGSLVAVIYLENNLTVGAFTQARLSLLQLLSGQAALAIHNATLYATLEQKVQERTRELRDKNEQLRRTQNQLVTQEKLASLGALAAGIAHELKNPLNFIINFANLSRQLADELAEELDEPGVRIPTTNREIVDETIDLLRQNTSKIFEQGKRSDQIITGMLQHSRKTAGERIATDLNALLAQNIRLAREGTHFQSPRLALEVHADYDENVGKIDAAASDLGRVFLNVFNNAIYALNVKGKKLGPSFTPTIHIKSKDMGERIQVRIRDNGTGIPESTVSQIFLPFFTTKPPGDGTGLGLSISHDIVVGTHGGEFDVDTVTDEYTEFIITLPRQASVRR